MAIVRTYPTHGAPLSQFARDSKQALDAAVKRLTAAGSLSIVGNGNAAFRIPGEDKFVIGGLEGPLKGGPAAVVVVGFDEEVYEGSLYYHHEEVIPFYKAIFQERPDVNVAFHTHSPHLVAWALAQRPLPLKYSPELGDLGIDEIPVTKIAARYQAEPVIEVLRAFPKAPALLHANHGFLGWGADLESTTRLIIALEEAARFVLEADTIHPLAGSGAVRAA